MRPNDLGAATVKPALREVIRGITTPMVRGWPRSSQLRIRSWM